MGHQPDAALTGRARLQAARNRISGSGWLFECNLSLEYSAFELRDKRARLRKLQSMNRAGKMNNNANVKSFFISVKNESCGKTFTDDRQFRQALSSYIAFRNQQRLHSSLRYLFPAEVKVQQAQQSFVN